MRVKIIEIPQGALAGRVLLHRDFSIQNTSPVPCFAEACELPEAAFASFGERVAKGNGRAIVCILGVVFPLFSAFFGEHRSMVATAGAFSSGIARAQPMERPSDAMFETFVGGITIGNAIPAGQQVTEMADEHVGSTDDKVNLTFAIVSPFQGLSLFMTGLINEWQRRDRAKQTCRLIAHG